MSKQQVMIRDVLNEMLAREGVGEDVVPMSTVTRQTDAVIAHLWQRADDPATYAEVASKMYRRHDLNTFELGTAQQYMSMMLETLLGPRPSGEEANDER